MLHNTAMLLSFLKKAHLFFKERLDRSGSVLIEFAFCCPVLVILLFFVLDVPLAYRVLLKMQKMSELTANMIRNVPSKSDTQITLDDLENISKAAGITLTGRLGSSSKPCKRYPFYLSTYVFCIEGTASADNSSFEEKWNVHIQNNLYDGTVSSNVQDTAAYSKIHGVTKFSQIKGLEEFKIHEGEIKLIVETVAWYKESDNVRIENISGGGGSGSNMFGDYNKNKSRVRGFNKNFYLITIPGRTVSSGEKVFGNRYSIMSCVEDIVDSEESPRKRDD